MSGEVIDVFAVSILFYKFIECATSVLKVIEEGEHLCLSIEVHVLYEAVVECIGLSLKVHQRAN